MDIESYKNLIDILVQNDYQYIIDEKQNIECIAVGIGDILFRLVNLQNNLVSKPVYINLDIFQSGLYKNNQNSESNIWFENPYNNFIFRINLLNDIIENSIFFKKKDFIFVITSLNALLLSKTNTTFNYRILQSFNLSLNPSFYNNTLNETILNFIKKPFIVFHTKLRLNNDYNYNIIKEHLNMFFSGLKIHKYNIILLGEQKFKPTLESAYHKITTIYPELLKLYNYNSDKILDLTKEYIYNELNYDEYKNDICLVHKAEHNICYGQGGQLCSSLLFGKTIFFNPIDTDAFYENMNLYNSGHRYFKSLDMINKYLLQIV
jgi:hypothetical protein